MDSKKHSADILMEIQEIHQKLENQCPSDYRINEIILFSYPFRRIRINAIVNKSPEKSIQQIYSVLLRTILENYTKEDDIIKFLGLHKEDFILRELYFLRERGLANLISGTWIVTDQGKDFIKDNSMLKVLEEEEFEFLFDTVSNEIIPKDFRLNNQKEIENKLSSEFNFEHKSHEILNEKNEQLSDIYKEQNNGKAYLVDYDKNKILFDKKEFNDYYLIEYIPLKGKENELEPFIEIRNFNKEITLEKRLSKVLSKKYPTILYKFSNSERTALSEIHEDKFKILEKFETKEILESTISSTETLSVWETQAKFEEALKTVKNKILIESPWIKRATLNYIKSIENALEKGISVTILYGIESNDEHHFGTIEKLRNLEIKYNRNFHLIHLPTHFEKKKNYKITGTHRKLVIKDEEYYIQGSFNFLSFNKKEGQKIANEESILINNRVTEKWKKVIKEYELNEKIVNIKEKYNN